MPIRDQFFTELKASKSFNGLTPQEQKELLASYANAAEAIFQQALEILRSVEAKLEEKLKNIALDQTKIAKEIKSTLQQIAKLELQENEEKDQSATAVLLANLEKQIEAL